jgi:BolA family transcriptional regulator, general stress-responsive regulator
MGPVQIQLQNILQTVMRPLHLETINESELHAGHEHMGPETHFRVVMVSEQFREKRPTERHRLVHATIAELLKDKIHAITLKLYTPEEWASAK